MVNSVLRRPSNAVSPTISSAVLLHSQRRIMGCEYD